MRRESAHHGRIAYFEPASYPEGLPHGQPVKEPARPESVIGGPVALDLLLARSDVAAVRVQHVVAYSSGFEFEVVAHFRSRGPVWDPMHGLAGLRGRHGDRYGTLSDEHLRVAVEFADGRKATNTGPPLLVVPAAHAGPMLHHGNGSAGPSLVTSTYWAWPLPPAGPLVFVTEWPLYDIPLTRSEVDGELLRAAATRSIELWPEEGA